MHTEPTQNTTTDPTAQLEALRTERARLLRERKAVDHAPVPIAEAESRLSTWLDGRTWTPDPALCAGLASPAGLSPGATVLPIFNPNAPGDTWATVTTALVPLLRDQLKAVLVPAVRGHYETIDPATCIGTEARAARLHEIDAALDEIETAEEIAIMALEERGLPVARRADARPEIVMSTFAA